MMDAPGPDSDIRRGRAADKEHARVEEYQRLLTARFKERCWMVLEEWGAGVSTRSSTIKSARAELEALADDVDEISGSEFVQRLVAVAGDALAVGCRYDDGDLESSHDELMVGLGVQNFHLWLGAMRTLVERSDSHNRDRFWMGLPARLRWSAAELGTEWEYPDIEIPNAAALAAALVDAGTPVPAASL